MGGTGSPLQWDAAAEAPVQLQLQLPSQAQTPADAQADATQPFSISMSSMHDAAAGDPFFDENNVRTRRWACPSLSHLDCHGRQVFFMIPFALAGLSFVLWVMVRYGVAVGEDSCVPGPGSWVPMLDVLNATLAGVDVDVKSVPAGFGGLQGIALSADSLYTFHTSGARVLALALVDGGVAVAGVRAQRLYNLSRDFPMLVDLPVGHIGGIDLAPAPESGLGGEEKSAELWLATHAADIDRPQGALIAVDPTSLEPLPGRVAARTAERNLDWVAFGAAQNVLYYGEFFNVRQVLRVDASSLEPLSPLPIRFNDTDPHRVGGIQFVQSATVDHAAGTLVLLGDDYLNTIYTVDLATGLLLQYQPLLAGNEADGIALDPVRNFMYVGYNRQHSHEQTLGQNPFVSVLRFQNFQKPLEDD